MSANEKEPETNQIKTILQSFKSSIQYTWEIEGESLFSDSKIAFNAEENQILSALLILESPTQQYRKKLWVIASGAKREMLNNKGYYHSLLNAFPSSIEMPALKTIDLDIHRTFGKENYFTLEGTRTKLRNILIAASRRLTSIGYCQGFNFIVGRILQVCDNEEETFWIFIQMVEKYLQLNYYTDLSGLMIDCVIMSRILNNMFPDIMNRLSKRNYDISLTNYLFKSFLCLFAENVSAYMLQTIWDALFIKGNITIFKALICLVKAHKAKMLSVKTLDAINTLFAEEMTGFKDKDMMIYYLLLKRYDFSKESIENNRLLFFPTLKARMIKISSSLSSNAKCDKNNNSNNDQHCNINSPICVKTNSNSNHHDVFVLRQSESQITIKKSYFFNECQSYPFEKESTIINDDFPSLLIERVVHSCNVNKPQTKSHSSIIRIDSFEGQEYIHSLIKEFNI